MAFGDAEALAEPMKAGLAFTLGAMGSARTNFYNDAFKRGGWDAAARESQALWVAGKREQAAAVIPTEMVLQANLLGNESEVRSRLVAFRDAGVTTLRLAPAGRDLRSRLETLGRAMELLG